MDAFVLIVALIFGLVGSTFGGVQSKARDTERQTDIKAIHVPLEAYFAQNGYYPTLTNMNDIAWRSRNLKGLDAEAFRDPEGNNYNLTALPTKYKYSYTAKGRNGDNCDNTRTECTTYELNASLEDGSLFQKKALN